MFHVHLKRMCVLLLLRGMLYVVVQSLSCVRLFATPRTAARQAALSFTISRSLLKLMSIESVMPSYHLILCHPFSACPQSFSASGSFPTSQLFDITWPEYWSFSFSISPSNEHSELISFRTDSLLSKTLSRIFSNTTVQKYQFFGAQ